jgi:pyruvate/2-oxoglutarate/acetoin dehydrogenase E1 component
MSASNDNPILAPGAAITYLEGIRQAIFHEMEADPSVFLLGEDVAEFGGAFKVTAGLVDRYGRERVINTPIAESAILGVAIGAALSGLRPIAEMQFIDFLACGFNHLVNFAATQRYRSGNPVPMVVRGPCGGNVRGSAFHSQNPEGLYQHAAGLKIVAPASAEDAYGLMRAAVRDPNPVLYLEHKYLYRRVKGTLPSEPTPIGRGRVVRSGKHLAVLTWGAMVQVALDAADQLAREDGVELEVVDLRTLKPLDEELIFATAKKTNRVLVLSEEPASGSVASEVAARVAEHAFSWLDAPVGRLTCLDTPVPYSPPLEDYYLPNVTKLCAQARALLKY